MTIFRWIMGVIGALLVAGAGVSFVIFISMDIPVWLVRARALWRGVYTIALLWFNIEVWGRVIWTITHW